MSQTSLDEALDIDAWVCPLTLLIKLKLVKDLYQNRIIRLSCLRIQTIEEIRLNQLFVI
jgi:hypothetical protein